MLGVESFDVDGDTCLISGVDKDRQDNAGGCGGRAALGVAEFQPGARAVGLSI
jgi:hypothetical protein